MELDGIQFEDDFDEYRARACSGGSTYGLMRRQAFAQGGISTRPTAPAEKRVVRQRSKSLIPPSVALSEEKSILKRLCEYTEISRKQMDLEQRRHSTACLIDARDASHINHLSPIRRLAQRNRMLGDGACVEESTAEGYEEDEEDERYAKRPSTGGQDFLRPPESLPPPSGSSSSSRDGGSANKPPLVRRRSFSVTPKGIVNEGDAIVAVNPQSPNMNPNPNGSSYFGSTGSDLHLLGKTSRVGSSTSLGSMYSGESSDTPVCRILMLGGPGVGKSALTQQFLTSEYMAAQNTSFDVGLECTVPVLLDGEETIMEFIDLPYTGDPRVWQEYDVDGYVIVYSITDRRSFQKAYDLLCDIRRSEKFGGTAVILVANKTDLVRSRLVGEQEAKAAANTYDCKYIEVSAILNHKVDDLLVGIVKQIRLKPERERRKRRRPPPAVERTNSGDTGCLKQLGRNTLSVFLGPSVNRFVSKSCENLLIL